MIRAILCALCLCSVCFGQQAPPAYYSSVCIVSCPPFAGSGTLVGVSSGKGIVATAAHIFEGGDRAMLACKFPNGYRTRARILAIDEAYDLAALEIADHASLITPPCVRIAKKEDGPFTRVGYPYYGDGRQHYTVGEYIGYPTGNGQSAWASSMCHTKGCVQSGYSGGALFNRHGEYCGVVSGTTSPDLRIAMDRTWGASGQALRRFLGRWMRVEP